MGRACGLTAAAVCRVPCAVCRVRPSGIRGQIAGEVLAAGVSPQQAEDALAVCAAFNATNRLADAFGFAILSPEDFQAGAKYLLKRGYR
jgi:hypothetical protein